MDLLEMARRIVAGQELIGGAVWDSGSQFKDLEGRAFTLIEDGAVAEEDVKTAIVQSFDKVFGTDYSSGDVPFYSPVEDLGVEEVFHELLHHAFSPERYTDYDSELEGALHEQVMRHYQSSLDSASSLFDVFEQLGFDGNKYYGGKQEISKDEAARFLDAFKQDVAKVWNPDLRKALERVSNRIDALIRRGKDVATGIYREMYALEDAAFEMKDELIPPGVEGNIRRWYRQMELDFRRLEDG